MSDDEDEGMLRIVESPSEESIAPSAPIAKPLQHLDHENRVLSNSGNIMINSLKEENKEKEEGEIDDDEPTGGDSNAPAEPVQCFDMPNIMPIPTPTQSASTTTTELVEKVENPIVKEEINETPKASRKRKDHSQTEATAPTEKRKTNETPTNHRSKRTSHQVASAAIAACFDEEELAIPSQPTSSHASKSQESTSKKQKKDATTNCCEKNEDTSDIAEKLSILDAAPGSTLVIEITVMYKCAEHLAFRTKGKDGDIYGMLSDTSSKMHAGLAAKRKTLPAKTENGVADDNSQGSSSSSSKGVNGNGRSGRGNSQVGDHHHHHNKNDKRKDAKRRNVKDGDEDIDVCWNDEGASNNLKLVETDTREMHDCHFEGCMKRFHLSSELNYHVTKFHRRKVVLTDSIACQTTVSSFDPPPPAPAPPPPPPPVVVAPAPPPQQQQQPAEPTPMPILRKEPAHIATSSPIYSDLSDDEEQVKKTIVEKNQTVKKPLTVPLQPASSSSSSLSSLASVSTPSSSTTTANVGTIGISGAMKNFIPTPAAIRNNTVFVTNSPARPQSQVTTQMPMPPSLPAATLPHQMPFGFHPGMLHPGMIGQFQPSGSRDGMGGVPNMQMGRTPSRQDQHQQQQHKIHELTKDPNPLRMGGGSGGPVALKPSHLQPQKVTPIVSTPNRPPNQFMAPNPAQQQQQNQHLFHIQQMQMAAARGIQMPTQSELNAFYQMMNNPMSFSQLGPPQPPPSSQHNQQK